MVLEARYIVDMNGYGIFTTAAIAKGEIVLELEDCVCVPSRNISQTPSTFGIHDLCDTVYIFNESDMLIHDDLRKTVYFDAKFTYGNSLWYYLNHAPSLKAQGFKHANVCVSRSRAQQKKNSLPWKLAFVTLEYVKAGEELCFNYGDPSSEWTSRERNEPTIIASPGLLP